MKVHLANYEPGRLGGGWTFQSNFAKALGSSLSDYEDADVYFITSASILQRDDVQKAKDDGKKIVLRCDNIIRNSRNRNTGMSRMKDMAAMADLVVYQSNFAKLLLDSYLAPKTSQVILNATDQDVFKPGETTPDESRFLYVKSSSDETKNWEMARVAFQEETEDPKSLTIVGKAFDDKLIEYNFDFYMGEKVWFEGEVLDRHKMAAIYQNHYYLLYSYFNDACSNTVIEALSCGMEIYDCYGMIETGGTPQILDKFYTEGRDYFGLPRMRDDYLRAMEQL